VFEQPVLAPADGIYSGQSAANCSKFLSAVEFVGEAARIGRSSLKGLLSLVVNGTCRHSTLPS
jgi:hypothetical protein